MSEMDTKSEGGEWRSLPKCRNVYFPYHIDFAAVTGYDEYNGEYSV